jgi:pimeloyl-ACP methyl ester carboxylesterase
MNDKLIVDGVDVLVQGEGAETIVMVHGWPDTWRLWERQVDALKDRYRCVRFTLPGFDIGKPRKAYTLEQLISTIATVVEQTCPERPVILLLHDWGCIFGYQYALRHPERVSRIIGVDVGDANSPEHVLGLKEKAMVFAYQIWLAAAWVVGGAIGNAMTRFMARALGCRSDPQYIGACMDYPYFIRWTGAHGSYAGLKPFEPACPMLFIYGRRKPLMFHSQPWAARVAAAPLGQVLAMDTGHWVMSQQPQAFNEAVLNWLARDAH